ncbi:MAG: ATP-binding protein [Patulibacter sp.]|nr:ATP-binding protein [Patulibacter sp.]
MNLGPARITAALTLAVAAALVLAEHQDGAAAHAALGAVTAILVIAAVVARVAIGRDRRRERRAARSARPATAPGHPADARGPRTLAGTLLVLGGVAVALLTLQASLGISFWALLLLGAGGVVLWSQTSDAARGATDGPPSGWQRLLGRRADDPTGEADRMIVASGIGLVVLGALVALSSLGALDATRTSVLQLVVALAAVLVVVAPFWLRLSRRAARERSERIRGDERAEVAAHLHDSVLQTLALIQRRSDDPREVAALARRQERELRLWLSGRSERPDVELMAALRAAAAAVEVEHAVEIDVVTTGAWPLDDRSVALLGAAREAMTNAARHAGDGRVSVFADVTGGRLEVFVRDRGGGFDVDAIPADRRGVRESIVGRMRRAGGRATITSSPESGTEVELEIRS